MADLDPADVSEAIDPDALLDGEEPESTYLEDAVHWVKVYSELVGLKQELLARVDALAEGMTDDAVRAAQFDDQLLRAEQNRFQRRLDYWIERARSLTEDRLALGNHDGGH